jgi:hypothetical protein
VRLASTKRNPDRDLLDCKSLGFLEDALRLQEIVEA